MVDLKASAGFLIAGVLALNVLGWIVALGGAAGLSSHGVGGAITGFIWWGVWFQFFVLVLISVTMFSNLKSLSNVNYTFLGMVTVILMVTADQSRKLIAGTVGGVHQSAQASLAGTIIVIISNILLILAIATGNEELQGPSFSPSTSKPVGSSTTTGAPTTLTANPVAAV